jgi:hypothetical protein
MYAVTKTSLASQQFCSCRDTERMGTGGPGEGSPLGDQPIQVRRLDNPVAQGGDRIRTLIVTDQKKNIGPIRSGSNTAKEAGKQQDTA